jgi:hypothetical protein
MFVTWATSSSSIAQIGLARSWRGFRRLSSCSTTKPLSCRILSYCSVVTGGSGGPSPPPPNTGRSTDRRGLLSPGPWLSLTPAVISESRKRQCGADAFAAHVGVSLKNPGETHVLAAQRCFRHTRGARPEDDHQCLTDEICSALPCPDGNDRSAGRIRKAQRDFILILKFRIYAFLSCSTLRHYDRNY